eukprot:m.722934 g.722934  ORF g.722934 m.722934 type:complete len:50 (+) comp23019_c3_seq59:1056-1205(+)
MRSGHAPVFTECASGVEPRAAHRTEHLARKCVNATVCFLVFAYSSSVVC